VLLVLAVVGLGCSSSKKAPATTPVSTASAAATPATSAQTPATSAQTPATSAPTSAPATASGGLSGTWSGKYGGAFSGTFTLTWQQSGSNLTGTIQLSAPAINLPINGTVQGGAIHFGTVGSVGVTYTGNVSSSSMSGRYQVQTGKSSTSGGSWSATKTS